MKRSELREHIFKMVFGYEFNSDSEMPQQMQLYFEQMEGGEPSEEDMEYIRSKALAVILKTEETDALLNANSKGWKTHRMNKVDLSILRLALPCPVRPQAFHPQAFHSQTLYLPSS